MAQKAAAAHPPPGARPAPDDVSGCDSSESVQHTWRTPGEIYRKREAQARGCVRGGSAGLHTRVANSKDVKLLLPRRESGTSSANIFPEIFRGTRAVASKHNLASKGAVRVSGRRNTVAGVWARVGGGEIGAWIGATDSSWRS